MKEGNVMKYKVGDVVKVIKGFWHEKTDPSIGQLAVITKVSSGYELRFLESGGTSAWWHDNQIKFVRSSTKEDFNNMDKVVEEREKNNHSLTYLKNQILNEEGADISPNGWTYLFEQIGYTSPFSYNGEYYCLFSDVRALFPLFVAIFKKSHEEVNDIIDSLFKEEYRIETKEKCCDLMNRI